MAEEELESPKEEKKGGKLKFIIIGLLLLLILGGGGYFAYTKFIGPKFFSGDAAEQTAEGEGQPGKQEPVEPGDTELVSLPTFVVNLADPLGRRYLKIAIDVEVIDKKAAEQLNASESKIRDAIILLLSSKTFADLSTMEDKISLKQEIVERLNQVLGGSKVMRVYFTEMVVQ